MADIAAEAARETVALVNAAGGQAISLTGEVARDAEVQTMVAGAVAAYGRLDCAFKNAVSPAGRSKPPARRPPSGPSKPSIG